MSTWIDGYRFLRVVELRNGDAYAFKLQDKLPPLSPHFSTRYALLYSVSSDIPIINCRGTKGCIVDFEHDELYYASYSLGGGGIWFRNGLMPAKLRDQLFDKLAKLL